MVGITIRVAPCANVPETGAPEIAQGGDPVHVDDHANCVA
jgi:hypothetical protein